jgi:hypothetical protein
MSKICVFQIDKSDKHADSLCEAETRTGEGGKFGENYEKHMSEGDGR